MEKYGKLRKNAPKETNSMKKFFREVSQKKPDGELIKAEEKFPITTRPTGHSSLSLRRTSSVKLAPIFTKEYYSQRKGVANFKPTGVIEYLPPPTTRKPTMPVKTELNDPTPSKKTFIGKDLMALVGNVQFVWKTYKLHPEFNILYEVYGNVTKVYPGKIRYEQIVLLRDTTGPVLQGFYFDFSNYLANISIGDTVRCVGEFTQEKRFRLHKIQLSTCPSNEDLTRIENVTSFALVQAKKLMNN